MTHPSQGSPTKYANTASLRSSSRDKSPAPPMFLTSHLLDLKESLLKPLFQPIFNLNPWIQGLLAFASVLFLWPIAIALLVVFPPAAIVGSMVYVYLFGWPALKADLKATNEKVIGLSGDNLSLPRKVAMLVFYQALNAALWITGLILAFGSNLNQSLAKQQSKLHVHEDGASVCDDCKKKEDKKTSNSKKVL